MTFSQTASFKKSKQKILASYALTIPMCIFLAGFSLNITLGEHFFFESTIPLESTSFWVFLALIPCSTLLLSKTKFDKQHSNRYPTWWVRRLLMFPLFALFISALVVTGPLRWLITYTSLFGRPNTLVSTKITRIEEYHPQTKSCDQRGEIAIEAR